MQLAKLINQNQSKIVVYSWEKLIFLSMHLLGPKNYYYVIKIRNMLNRTNQIS